MSAQPFVRLLPAFIAGILLAFFAWQWLTHFVIGFASLILLGFFLLKNGKTNDAGHFLMIQSLLVLLGMSVAFRPAYEKAVLQQENLSISGKFLVQVSESKALERFFRIEGKMMLHDSFAGRKTMIYLKKDSLVVIPQPGDFIALSGKLQTPSTPLNPGDFDFKNWLLTKGISLQGFIENGNWKIISGHSEKATAINRIHAIRAQCAKVLETYLEKPENSGFAKALLIGIKDGIDPEVREAFAGTGTIHILAVSGLHVGIIYLFLGFIFYPIPILSRIGWPRMLASLIVIWGYALLTGLSPSVSRAALMFSILAIGEAQFRRVPVLNSIAFSAFLLLLLNPSLLFNLGFQLSYLAVIGIVTLAEPIQNLLIFRNTALEKVWQLASVSLAAQIATAPLTMYHFHQFPVYFLMANLLILPLVPFMVGSGVLLLIFYRIDILASFFGRMTEVLIEIERIFANAVYHLPVSLIDDIEISMFQAFALLIVPFSLTFWLIHGKIKGLFIALLACNIFLIFEVLNQLPGRDKLIVYAIPGKSLLQFTGEKSTLISVGEAPDESWLDRNSQLKKVIRNSPLRTHVNDSANSHGYIENANMRMVWVGKNFNLAREKLKLENSDILLLSGFDKKSILPLLADKLPTLVLMDGKCKPYRVQAWKDELDSLKIQQRYLLKEGAWILEL